MNGNENKNEICNLTKNNSSENNITVLFLLWTKTIVKKLKWKNNDIIIQNICNYLNQKSIAMICLREMRKIKVGSFYMHNEIN